VFKGFASSPRCVRRLGSLVALSILAFAGYGLYSLSTLRETKVNGPSYERIVQGKDLVADVLPPPSHLMEAYLTLHLMLNDRGGLEQLALEQRFERLRAAYRERHAYWLKTLPDGEMKRAFLGKSYVPGLRMLESVETGFLPALKAGDRGKAQAFLEGPIREDYEEHRAHIDDVVELAVKSYEDDEAVADGLVAGRARTLLLAGLFTVVLLSIAGWVAMRALSETLSLSAGNPGPEAA
jgi:methyl-accepting chemotaxis protein